MSKQSHLNFLNKLDAELKRSSSDYRSQTANRRLHYFKFTVSDLIKQTDTELNKFRKLNLDENDFKPLAEKILPKLRAQAKKFKLGGRTDFIKTNQYGIEVTILEKVNVKTDTGYENFVKLKQIYKEAIDAYAQDLLDLAHSKGKTIRKSITPTAKSETQQVRFSKNEIKAGSDLFEGGHDKGAGVFESKVKDAVETSLSAMSASDNSKRFLSEIEAMGVDLSIQRDDKTDTHTIFIESRIENRLDGNISAKNRSTIVKQLKAAIAKISEGGLGVTALKGSDSIQTKKRKEIIKTTLDPFKNIKGVTVTSENTKVKKSNNAKVTKKIKPKTTVAKSKAAKVKEPTSRRGRSNRQKTNTSPLKLMNLINAKLPQTVAQNMGSPALNYRSGRFASSTRVVDVTTTRKGFTSFGYTYMRNPYETFEPGNAQGSVERDPRRLIDKSIREIAAELAIGRFYTRRV